MISPRRDFFHGEVVDIICDFSVLLNILVYTFAREVSRDLPARDCLQGKVVTTSVSSQRFEFTVITVS